MLKKKQTEPPPAQFARRRKLQWDYLTADGREKPDPTPIAPPIGYIKQPTLREQIHAMVRNELSQAAAAQGAETFEESEDFDVGDYDPRSPYEELFDPPPNLPGMAPTKPVEPAGATAGTAAPVEPAARDEPAKAT